MAYPKRSVETRLEMYSVKIEPSGCWIWMRNTSYNGYGVITIENKTIKAHRAAWECWRGPIPNGMHVLHKCDVPCCINPNHLFLGTHHDNMKDVVRKGRWRGERNSRARLTEDDVREIRQSKLNSFQLADIYGVAPITIRAVRSGRNWSHVA